MGLFGKKKENNKIDQEVLMEDLQIENDESSGEVELDLGAPSNPIDTSGLGFENDSHEEFEIPDIAGEEDVPPPSPISDNEEVLNNNKVYTDDDRQNEVMDFLSNFSDADQEEVILNPIDLQNIQEDIVLDGGEKKSYTGIIIAIIIGLFGALIAFFIAFIISSYNMVMDPVVGASFVYDGKISLAEKNPTVISSDLKDGYEVLYKDTPQSRFVDNYNKGVVKKIMQKTVRVYNEKTKETEDIPYEQIWYVIDNKANGDLELNNDSGSETTDTTTTTDTTESSETDNE